MENIEKAIELKKELDSLRPIKKDDELRIMQKFRLDWNYHSNNLEGNSLTYGETKALILFGITAQGKPLKDHFEVTGHDEAIKWILEVVKQDRPLTENFIRELHTLILKEPYEVDAITPDGQPTKKRINVGSYKTTPNHVRTKTGEIFRFSTPEETPAKMNDLISWYNKKLEEGNVNPIILAAEFHYRYIRIHPFDDGNGRTARIIMNFIFLQFNYPPVIIKTEDKENYFAALRQADAGILKPFLNYIAQNLINSFEIMISGAKGESIEEPDDIDKEILLLERRFKMAGKEIEITKSKEVFLELYDNTIKPIAQKFIQKGELFEKFYVTTSFHIWVNNGANHQGKNDAISKSRLNIKEDTTSIRIDFHYQNLNQVGLENFNYESQIQFHFDFSTYVIKGSDHTVITEKKYGESLSENEINEIVNGQIRIHKNIIEEKITELKK